VPPGFQRIRYYGFLANCHRVDRLHFCRRCLAVPGSDLLPPPMAYREFREFYFHLTGRNLKRCPQCGIGTMIQIEILFSCHGPIPIRLDASGSPAAPNSRPLRAAASAGLTTSLSRRLGHRFASQPMAPIRPKPSPISQTGTILPVSNSELLCFEHSVLEKPTDIAGIRGRSPLPVRCFDRPCFGTILPDFRPAPYFWYDASMGQTSGRGAIVSTFASLASLLAALTCCLPLGTLLLSAGSAGASLFSEKLRPWLLAFSVAALVFAFVQTYFRGRCAFRHRRLRTCLLWFSATVLLGMLVMPHYVSSLMAGRLPSFSASSGLRDFDEHQFIREFDAALGQTRIVLLLSPT